MDLLGRTRAFYVGTLSGHVPGRVRLSRKLWLIIRSPGISRTQVPVYPREANILPPTPGATCPNKTNKSGGPKDVADAFLPSSPRTKMLSLTDWKEWMGTLELDRARATPPHTATARCRSINQTKLISIFKAAWWLDQSWYQAPGSHNTAECWSWASEQDWSSAVSK